MNTKELAVVNLVSASLLFAACEDPGGSYQGGEATDFEYQRDERLVTESAPDEWRPKVTYSADYQSASVEMNTMCLSFHLDTPASGQTFTLESKGARDLLGVVSEMYEHYVNLSASGYHSTWLARGREEFIELLSKEVTLIKELEALLGPQEETESAETSMTEKQVLDRIFQVASWRVSDELTLEDLAPEEEVSPSDFSLFFTQSEAEEIAALVNQISRTARESEERIIAIADEIVAEAERIRTVSLAEPSDEPHLLSGVDIFDARDQDMIELSIRSSGGYNGRTMILELDGLSSQPTAVTIPNGIRLGSGATLPSTSFPVPTSLEPEPSELLAANGITAFRPEKRHPSLKTHWLDSPIALGSRLTTRQGSVQTMEGAGSVRIELNEPSPEDETVDIRVPVARTDGTETVLTCTLLPWTSDPEGRVLRTAVVSGVEDLPETAVRIYVDSMMAGRPDAEQQLLRDHAPMLLADIAAHAVTKLKESLPDKGSDAPQDAVGEATCETFDATLDTEDPDNGNQPTPEEVSYCSRWIEADAAWMLWTTDVDVVLPQSASSLEDHRVPEAIGSK